MSLAAGPVRRRGRRAPPPQPLQKVQHEDDLVHPRCVPPQPLTTAAFSPVAPGHSLETFPDQMAAVRDAGHEMCVPPAPLPLNRLTPRRTQQRPARLLARGRLPLRPPSTH